MGGELMLLALGGCFMNNLLAAIAARGAEISDVRVAVEARLEGTPEIMSTFTIRVEARCEDRAELVKLTTVAERGCIVANTLRRHAPIHVVAEPRPHD
jgi:putative redox protein